MSASSLMLLTALIAPGFADADESGYVAQVDGQKISIRDVTFLAELRGEPLDRGAKIPDRVVEEAIDRTLIRQFLAGRKVTAHPELLAQQLQQVEALIRRRQEEPEAFLKRLGFTQEQLEQELSLPLAWAEYVRRTVPATQIRQYFDEHRSEFDGTKIRARHIVLQLPKDASPKDLEIRQQRLAAVRKEILAGNRDFAAAARETSESPSKETGGDLGVIPFRGRIPASVAQAAFRLQAGEITEPVVSPFGVHLVFVEERIPGQLSLEDARPQILEVFGKELWEQTAKQQRGKVKITRPKL